MPIKLNGTTFNNGGTAKFNGTTIKEIKFGTTTVWKAETYLWNNGSYDSSTGGWEGTCTVSSGNIYYSIGSDGIAYYSTKNKINFASFSSITISLDTYNADAYSATIYFGASNSKTDANFVYSRNITDNKTGAWQNNRTLTIDTSSWTGTYYFKMYVHAPVNGGTPNHQIRVHSVLAV